MKQSKVLKIIDVLSVLIITFLLNVINSILVAIVYSVILTVREGGYIDPQLMLETMNQNISLLTFSSIYNVFAIGVVILFWRFADKRRIEELGFGITGKTAAQVTWGILAAVGAISLIIIFGEGFGIISFQGFGTNAYAGTEIAASVLLGALTFLMVGFGEETVYRTYIQNQVVDMTGNRYGLVISAFIFAGVHLFTYGKLLDLFDVFLAGIILGYAYMLTKSIYLPAMFHFMWDFLQINIFRLQDYENYKGPVLVLFKNSGDLIINNYNLGNKLELIFIIVEVMMLILIHTYRKRLQKLIK
jgi:membrane protease YdiL (CAAX protease family)